MPDILEAIKLTVGKLNLSSGFRHYIANTMWLFAEKFLGAVAVLFVGVWIARYLGPVDFGKLSFAQSLVMLFSVVATLGLIRIIDRELVPKSSNQEQIVNTSVVLVMAGAVLVYTLLLAFLWIRDYEKTTSLIVAIVGIGTFFQVNRVYTAFYYSQVRARKVVIATVLALILSNVIKIAFILLEAPLVVFAVTIFLDSAILFPVLLYISRDTRARLRLHAFSLTRARNLLRDSWPYILSGFLATVYLKIDTIMIKELAGNNAAGQYAAAARLSEGLHYIAITLMSSLYPAIVNSKATSESLYRTRLSSLYSFLFYLAIAIAIFVGFLSERIIAILYGPAFTEAASVLFIHVWSCVFFFVGTCSSRWLLTENLQKLVAINTLLGASLNVALNFYLIPRYGIEGAAWATMISYSFVAYLCFVLWKSTRENFILMSRAFFRLPKLNW